MIENWKEFYAEIEKLSLPELEAMIKKLYKEFQRSSAHKDYKLNACLKQRKYLINKDFKFTPEAVKHIERVNRILTDGRAKVLNRCSVLYRQMLQIKRQGDDFLDDFEIEGTVTIQFSGEESVLTLDEDENNGQSDYVAMADVLEYTSTFEILTSFLFSYSEDADLQENDKELGIIDTGLEFNWNIELLDAPELTGIEYFCYSSHILFVDSNYSISDAIRIDDIWNEVKVTHQNFVRKSTNIKK
jgi:hypothetical protein